MLVLLVCALIAGLSFWTLVTVGGQVTGATARSSGEVIRAEGRTVDVRWSAAGAHRTDTVTLGVPAPPVGTRTVQLHGDPRRRGLVAAEVGGVWLDPSGPIRATEPRGRRIDSPARPDPDALADTSWRRQLRADAMLLTPAPVVGLLWVYLDGGGPATWTCATALTATLAPTRQRPHLTQLRSGDRMQ